MVGDTAVVKIIEEERKTVEYETETGTVKLNPSIVKKYLVSGRGEITDEEVVMFMQLCRYQKLNPFLREAFCIKYGNAPATLVVARDAFNKRAEQHPQFAGLESGIWVATKDGKNEQRKGTILFPGETLLGGWARVYRKDRTIPREVAVTLSEYLGRKHDGTVTSQWDTRPATMICKVAEAQGLRSDFPNLYQSLYSQDEELAQAPTPQTSTQDTEEVHTARAQVLELLANPVFTLEQRKQYTNIVGTLMTTETLMVLAKRLDEEIKKKATAEVVPPMTATEVLKKKEDMNAMAAEDRKVDESGQQEIF